MIVFVFIYVYIFRVSLFSLFTWFQRLRNTHICFLLIPFIALCLKLHNQISDIVLHTSCFILPLPGIPSDPSFSALITCLSRISQASSFLGRTTTYTFPVYPLSASVFHLYIHCISYPNMFGLDLPAVFSSLRLRDCWINLLTHFLLDFKLWDI